MTPVQHWNLDLCECGHEREDHAVDRNPNWTECYACPLAFISKRGHSPSKCNAFRPKTTRARRREVTAC